MLMIFSSGLRLLDPTVCLQSILTHKTISNFHIWKIFWTSPSCTIMICDNICLLLFFYCASWFLEWLISEWMEQAPRYQMTRETVSQTDRQTDRPENLTCQLFLDVQEMMHAHNTVDASQCIVWTLYEHEFLLNIFHSLLSFFLRTH